MLTMFDALGTPKNMKVKQAMANVGDHVMGSYLKSKDLLEVQQATEQFITRFLKIEESHLP